MRFILMSDNPSREEQHVRFDDDEVMVCFYVTPFLQIVSRYDIIVILEVVDSSGDAVDHFLEELNK